MKFVVFGGGGKVARHLAKLGSQEGHQIVSVVRNDDHVSDLESLGARPSVLSLESAPVTDLTDLLTKEKPDVVVFAAGAGGKGDPSRTRAVDYDGAVKVYDAMEAANVKRLVLVGAIDVRNREKGYPEWYSADDKKSSDKGWEAIGRYMQAKYDAEAELHRRKAIAFTVLRPGGLTLEPAGGALMGLTPLKKTRRVPTATGPVSQSFTAIRELVAKGILAVSSRPETEGMTIDIMDGDKSLDEELTKVVEQGLDSWTG